MISSPALGLLTRGFSRVTSVGVRVTIGLIGLVKALGLLALFFSEEPSFYLGCYTKKFRVNEFC